MSRPTCRIVATAVSKLTRCFPEPRRARLAALSAVTVPTALRSMRHLNQPADGIARQPEAVLKGDLAAVSACLAEPSSRWTAAAAAIELATPTSP